MTIIVLLILAGVSIATLTGDSGIITKATDAQIISALSNVDEMIELYKIMQEGERVKNGNYSGDMSNEELRDEGILREVTDKSTGRRLGILQDFDKIDVNEKLGKGYKDIDVNEEGNIESVTKLYNVFAIDFEDDTLYYIKNEQVWSIGGENNLKQVAERIKFITEWTITADNEEIELPLDSSYKMMVEWGDGAETLVESTNPDSKKHTYEKAGTYNVKIRTNIEGGSCQSFRFARGYSNAKTQKDKITKIVQWGEVDVENINFSECTNLKGEIPSPTDKSFRKVKLFQYLFSKCTNLEGKIPKDLFKNASNPKIDFSFAFSDCENLEGEIPGELFQDVNEEIYSVSHLFSGCKNLTGTIPSELFKNKKIGDFTCVFQKCSKISGIGEGLFDDAGENVKVFYATFSGTAIKEIPKDLFKYNVNVTTFYRIFDACGQLEEIPDGLFSTNINATNFSNAFYNCKKIKGKIRKNIFPTEVVENEITFTCTFMYCTSIEGIEEDAFDNYPNITSFDRTFNQCNSLSGKVPELWNRDNVKIYAGCFPGTLSSAVSTITNYSDIPEDWRTV